VAEGLAARGDRVFGAARRFPEPKLPFATLHLELREPEAVTACVAQVLERAGRIDALVHFAGMLMVGALELFSDEEARELIETNLLGTYRISRAVIPHMRAQQAGRIIHVSSVLGRMGTPFSSLYAASKFGVEGLSESLRYELEPFGIKLSVLEPGRFHTPMTQRYREPAWAASDRAYRVATKRALASMGDEGRAVGEVSSVVRAVQELLDDPSPPFRKTVGAVGHRLAVSLQRFLPEAWITTAIRRAYRQK